MLHILIVKKEAVGIQAGTGEFGDDCGEGSLCIDLPPYEFIMKTFRPVL